MKKLIVLATLTLFSACGVQRPYPLTISQIAPTSYLPYSTQNGIQVADMSMYNIRIDWDVTGTNAQGVKILAAPAADYNCSEPIAVSMPIYSLNSSSNTTTTVYQSLAYVFYRDLEKFTVGDYALCLVAIRYNSESAPSIPVFMTLLANQAPMGIWPL